MHAFKGCWNGDTRGLKNIDVNDENKEYSSINGVLFNKAETHLIQYPCLKSDTFYIIPDSVTSIEDSAFAYCDILESVIIPDGIISIGESAFFYCDQIKIFTIPKSVENIGLNAFQYCRALENITVDLNNKHYSSLDGVLFNKDKSVLIKYPTNNERLYYVVPDTVNEIYDYAFYYYPNLTGITISDNVKRIGEYAFACWVNLESVVIPDSVTEIATDAFAQCYNLKTITLPASITFYDAYVFFSCESITDVYYMGTEEQWEQVYVYDLGNHEFLEANFHFLEEPLPETPEEDPIPEEPDAPSEDCTCNCHKTGFMSFLWKIILFFQKLFKTNQFCSCGIAHY